MARKSTIPEDILKYKPCSCCRVVSNNGTYRVYKYKAVKLSNGKWNSDWGHLIGKIVPGEGFIPNKRYKEELEKDEILLNDSITDVAYGQYSLLNFLSSDVLERLNKFFPSEKAAQIYSYAMILCVNGLLHVAQTDEFYKESFMSLIFSNCSFSMDYKALYSLLRDLGMKTNPVRAFEKSLVDGCSKNIAIEGHVISLNSEDKPSGSGYNINPAGSEQFDILIAYDAEGKYPLMYRTYLDSGVDENRIAELLRSRSFTNTKFVLPSDFYSDEILKLVSQNGNQYIIQLSSDNKNVKRIRKTLKFSSDEFIYQTNTKDCTRIVYYEERISDSARIIVYKNTDENNAMRKNYMQLMAADERSYTQKNYDKYCEWWGVYFLQTNTDDPADIVYDDYKKGKQTELSDNPVKSNTCFNDPEFQDYYTEHGFEFIMLAAGLIRSKLENAVRNLNMSDISVSDILVKAGRMRMVNNGSGQWQLHNINTRDLKLFDKLGYMPETLYEI